MLDYFIRLTPKSFDKIKDIILTIITKSMAPSDTGQSNTGKSKAGQPVLPAGSPSSCQPISENTPVGPPVTMTFLLIEQYSAMCLISAIEGLRAANHVSGSTLYTWKLISHDGNQVEASNGMNMAVEEALSPELSTDYLFIVASLNYSPAYLAKLNSHLRQLDRRGIKLGGISLGTWILARAGLLDKAKCTIHWEGIPAFQETFPDIDLVSDLFVIDNNRYTASGGVADLEMMLEIIRQDHGEEMALKIANNFQLDRVRTAGSVQRSGSIIRMDTMPSSIQQAVKLMMANLETPLTNSEIAKHINTSIRNLERTFMRKLNTSPAKYYLALRLEKARELLLHTNLSTLEIALQCGFSSSSYFARCFQREFLIKPSDIRKKH